MEITNESIKKIVAEILKQGTATPKSDGSQDCSLNSTDKGVFMDVSSAVSAAKIAYKELASKNLSVREDIVEAIKEKMKPFVPEIAQKTFEETKMGRVEDKIQKLDLVLDKTPGVEDLKTEAYTGDHGMTLYELSPFGVVGAVTPSTNPAETLICNAIGMIAAGNSVYFSVHPGAKAISKWIVSKLNEIIWETSGINNLVVTIDQPSIEAAQEMMHHPEVAMLVVTGGPGVVHEALSSGKKTIGAGAGNPPSLVDETANIEKAAKDIVFGASFDNNILCIAEKSVVVVEEVADYLIHHMERNGAFLLTDPEKIAQLKAITIENGHPSRLFVGRNANVLLNAIGIQPEYDVKIIILKALKDDPFVVKEMLMPILPIVSVSDFEAGLEVSLEIEQGLHHTATMHSMNVERLNKAAKQMQTSIFVKNGPSYAGLGVGGEGTTTFTIATPTGEGTTTARNFARRRRCVLTDGFSIR